MSSYRKGKMVCDIFCQCKFNKIIIRQQCDDKKVYNSTKYDLIYKREIYQPELIL